MKLSKTSKSTNLKTSKKRFWKKCKRESCLTDYDKKKFFDIFTFLGIFKYYKFYNIKNFEVPKYVLLCTSYYKILSTFVLFQTLVFSEVCCNITKNCRIITSDALLTDLFSYRRRNCFISEITFHGLIYYKVILNLCI